MSPLSSRQRKSLRGLAHALEPVVHVGKGGVTDAIVAQVDRALDSHELIKVRARLFSIVDVYDSLTSDRPFEPHGRKITRSIT